MFWLLVCIFDLIAQIFVVLHGDRTCKMSRVNRVCLGWLYFPVHSQPFSRRKGLMACVQKVIMYVSNVLDRWHDRKKTQIRSDFTWGGSKERLGWMAKSSGWVEQAQRYQAACESARKTCGSSAADGKRGMWRVLQIRAHLSARTGERRKYKTDKSYPKDWQ